MNNGSEMERWLKDAHASLASAEKAFQAGDYRVATQNAQLCTELSAKAIIALFAEPAWRHDPGKQLQSLLEKHKQQITQQLDDQTRQNLVRLAQDADEVAPWHGWSTFRLRSRQAYGRGEEDDVWIAAVDLCTQSVADDLLERARRSVETVAAFIQHTNETSHTSPRVIPMPILLARPEHAILLTGTDCAFGIKRLRGFSPANNPLKRRIQASRKNAVCDRARYIHTWKRKDWLLMPRRSPSSVRVCYPRYNQETLVALLRERVSALAAVLPLKRVALFGSWARGRATAFSDIDLLVIYADPARENVYQLVRRSIKLRGLEPHIYSEQQAQQMQATLERMTRQGIVLFPSGDEENKSTGASTE